MAGSEKYTVLDRTEQVDREGGLHSDSGGRDIRWLIGVFIFALFPWITLGLGTWLAFLVPAAMFRRPRRLAVLLWGSAVVHGITAIAVMAVVAASDASTGSSAAGTR